MFNETDGMTGRFGTGCLVENGLEAFETGRGFDCGLIACGCEVWRMIHFMVYS
jgi:hypothetical protein